MSEPRVQKNIEKNKEYLRNRFSVNDDLVIREFTVGKHRACIVGIVNLIDHAEVAQFVIAPLLRLQGAVNVQTLMDHLETPVLSTTDSLEEVAGFIAEHNMVVLFVDGLATAMAADVAKSTQRPLREPENETVVRGPHIGFVENLGTNLLLVRRYVNNPDLRIQYFTVGQKTQVRIALAYLDGTADKRLVDMVQARLSAIQADGILGCGFVEQFIEDAPTSIFPTIFHTERPDVLAGNLLEGRISVLTNGCGTALIMPHLFLDNFQNAEDYHTRPFYSSFMRIVRFLGFLLSTELPAFYIAIENFHKELLPSSLLISLAGAREGVPFPLGLEVLLMLGAFELIKEAGLRMPKPIASSVSVVAGLILGEAAVDSGFVGITTIIIVASAGLSSFLSTSVKETSVILRFLLVLPAAFVGLYGLILANLVVLIHIVGLRSFQVPYLAPIAPAYFRDWKDSLIRLNLRKLRNKDESTKKHNIANYID